MEDLLDTAQQHEADGLGFAPMPSSEYKVIFRDGTVSMLDVHPERSLRGCVGEMLKASGAEPSHIQDVVLLRTYDADAAFEQAYTALASSEPVSPRSASSRSAWPSALASPKRPRSL